MAYTVYNNNGSVLVNIQDGTVDDSTTSLQLVGKNVNNYGEYIANNFVKILTSFADTQGNEPANPIVGQLFYNRSTEKLTVFDGTEFRPVQGASVGSPPTSPSSGDLWFDGTSTSGNRQLKLYDGTSWRLIGPVAPEDEGKFGIEPPYTAYSIASDAAPYVVQKTGVIYSNGRSVGIISTTSFVMSTTSYAYYFASTGSQRLSEGITILKDLDVRRNLYVQGAFTFTGALSGPFKNLSAYYDRTWIGSAITDEYTATNNFIRLEVLPYIFSTSTTATILNSEVKVLSSYNTFTEVRHFILQDRVPGIVRWEAYEKYLTDGTSYFSVLGSTLTNVVRIDQ